MSSPDLTDAERDAVLAVLHTPHLSLGPEYPRFEQAMADYAGVKHAISVNSGTAGLHLCVRAAGLTTGDLTLTTPFSFMASSNVLLYENAVPVFVDVDPVTGNIDPALAAEAARDLKTGGAAARRWLPRRGASDTAPLKALLPVDVFGQPAEYDSLLETARAHDLTVIEDSCEAIGATYKGKLAGTFGRYGVFAFYPNKQITTAEGGIIVTDDDEAATLMRALRNQGRAPGDTWLQHTYLGYNYRLDELSAALGRVQMTRLDDLLAKRQRVANWYATHLEGLPEIEQPKILPATTKMSWFVYVVRVPAGVDRDAVIDRLGTRGIPARPYFAPIHLQPFMVERFGYQPGDFPITEDLGARGMALPFSSIMTEDQVADVCAALGESL
ncbi:MAG: DegT/DnrJ/EryC1/StrS family aminotransferase [Anaerolineae bacterium]|nr:MAG: DegT/DnrJ/EryC1/StrS family aminotransferase [Anaerolineae bacterium]